MKRLILKFSLLDISVGLVILATFITLAQVVH